MKKKIRVTSVGTPTEFPGWPGKTGFQVPLFFSAALYDGTKQSISASGSVKEMKQTAYGQSTPAMEYVCVGGCRDATSEFLLRL